MSPNQELVDVGSRRIFIFIRGLSYHSDVLAIPLNNAKTQKILLDVTNPLRDLEWLGRVGARSLVPDTYLMSAINHVILAAYVVTRAYRDFITRAIGVIQLHSNSSDYSLNYRAFLITADVPEIFPRVPGCDFDALPSEEDTISFLRDLGHTGVINSLNDVVIDQMHQPWRTFAAIINRSLSGKTSGLDKLRLSRAQILWGMYHQKYVDYVELLWEDFTYQIDNKVYKKQEKIIRMHTSKDDYLINTLRFVSRKEASQIYGAVLPECLTSPEMKESKAYKTYLGYATGEVPPKVARKFKKASPSKKESELVPGDEEPIKKGKRLKTPAKKSASKPATGIVIREPPVETKSKRKEKEKVDVAHGKGIELLSEVALSKKAQMKEARKKSLRDFHIDTSPCGFWSRLKNNDSEQEEESEDDDQEDEEFVHTPSPTNDKDDDYLVLCCEMNDAQKGNSNFRDLLKETKLLKILPKEVSNFAPPVIKALIKEPRDEVTLAKMSSQPHYTNEAASSLSKFKLKKILIDKMEKSESYLAAPEHRDCYDSLKKSSNLNKDFFFSFDVYMMKRSRQDKDKDEDHSAGSDRGLNRRKTSKDAESTIKEPVSEVANKDIPQDHEGDMGNDNAEP
ncbi:hypothetical protein Tco_0080312 [Tanacetum coccineum]